MKDKSKKNKSKTNGTGGVKKQLAPKRNITVTRSDDNGIGMSKQLQLKLQNSKRPHRAGGMPKSRSTKNSEEPRVCGNGKPMPSLVDLERMFEDSDTDDEQPRSSSATDAIIPTTVTSTCSTPKKNYQIPEDKLKSPNTIKLIADRILDRITNLSDSIEILDNDSPLVPTRKRKKSDVPYIVGCKDRPQIPNQENGKKFKLIHDTYRESNTNLKACLTFNNSDRPRSFSPIPSTSKDSVVIHKNDILFNKSLQATSSDEEENNIEIISPSYETITIDDSVQTIKSSVVGNGTIIDIDNESNASYNKDKTCEVIENINDNACEIIEYSTVGSKDEPPIIVDEFYKSVDLSVIQPSNLDPNEVIDIDDVIAENNAIIEKYKIAKQPLTVTSVTVTSLNSPPNSTNTSAPSEQSEGGPSIIEINSINTREQHESRTHTTLNNNTSLSVGRRRPQQAVKRNTQPQETRPQPDTLPKGLGDCPICMDSLGNNPIASTVCGHVFCMECIKAAVRSSGKKCPTCRKAMKGQGFHPIFL